ncbi:MAG: YIP1 family protein [Thermaceae bacterium]|nr:YIP1 family protein [Thermaceae bacterium]
MNATPSITDTIMNMVSQSIQVLSKPSVATFEQYEKKGTMRDALIYVGVAAVLTGLLGLTGGLGGFIRGVLVTLIGFFVFTYLVHWFGKQQGGSGTLDEVGYSFSLFWGPLAVIFGIITLVLVITLIGIFLIPLLVIVAIIVNVYFAYLAVQSSMNLKESGKIWLTMVVAFVGTLVVNIILSRI